MAAVDITISGVLWDKYARTGRPVVLIGEATLTGLGVGGGPIIPPEQPPGGGEKPPGIWGGANEPFPTPPIYLPPPGFPGDPPHPAHPIVLPPCPIEPPVDLPPDLPPDTVGKPPPEDGGWGYSPRYGWGYFPGPTEPGPKSRRRG